jgi:hypothetical protein
MHMSDWEESFTEFPPEPRPPQQIGIGLAVAALVLPLLTGCVLFFVTDLVSSMALSGATVLVTALLLSIDAGRLGSVDLEGQPRISAGALFFGMVLLWIVFYPFAFFRRSHFGGPNLGVPSILVALFFVGVPMLPALLIPPTLPACDSREVVQLLDQMIRGTPLGKISKSIDGHHEIGTDPKGNRRNGECVAHTHNADIVVKYVVEWKDRANGQYQVRIPLADLPACTSGQVLEPLERLIRATPGGADAKLIDGHREISYDRAADRRYGQCVVHTDGPDIVVDYLVEWQDHAKGLIQVRLLAAELPACTSPETVQLLEQVIRGTPAGAKAKSIDGHRELSYDRVADRRQGQCVVHSDGPDMVVKYVVEWRDRDKGIFGVQIVE